MKTGKGSLVVAIRTHLKNLDHIPPNSVQFHLLVTTILQISIRYNLLEQSQNYVSAWNILENELKPYLYFNI